MTLNLNNKALWLLKFCLLVSYISVGQSGEVSVLRQNFQEYADKTLQEKVFVHTDKSAYLAGETVWFKIYNLDGNEHKLLDVSKVVYLEILDKESVPVLQTKVAMADGTGNGSIIIPASINSGYYTIRAYTNWMKNFSSDYFFEKQLTIVNTFKRLDLEKVSTATAYDVQFFPEGGNLVNGLQSKVAFKAVDKSGKGVDLTGHILTEQNDTVATIQTHKFGIGQFSFTPVAGKAYKAILKTGNGEKITKHLPAAHASGVVMQLTEPTADKLLVTVSTTEAVGVLSTPTVYLLVHTRNDLKALEEARIGSDGKAVFQVDKNTLGDGISHFTVFNSVKQPMVERIFFKKPSTDQYLTIQGSTAQQQYAQRSQVMLDFAAQNNAGQAEMADMSVAVFRVDSLSQLKQQDFMSYLWLTSDLKGAIENPVYYLGEGKEVEVAIDNLMLTHGWRRFSWENVQSKEKQAYKYIPEFEGHLVQGRVLRGTSGEPARNIKAFLASPSQTVNIYAANSDKEGNILFDVKHFYGSRDLIVQSDSKADSTYRFQIESPFSAASASDKLPAFELSKSLAKHLETSSLHLQVQNYHLPASYFQGLVPYHDNAAFYGSADKTYLLDDYTRFPVMEEVMREYVQPVMVRKRGGKFNFIVLDTPRKNYLDGSPLVLLDGVPVFDVDKIMAYDPRKVKRLDVVARRYYLGPLTFDGIVSFSTYDGDMKDYMLDEKVLLTEYDGLQLKREFYSPDYALREQANSVVPDLRTVLNWTPSLKTGKDGKQQLSFYSSDQAGKYMVVVYGVTKSGKVGNDAFTFSVTEEVL